MTKLGTIEKTNDLYYAETINKRRVWQRATSRSLLVVYFDKISLKSVYYYAWFGGGKLKKKMILNMWCKLSRKVMRENNISASEKNYDTSTQMSACNSKY